MLKDALLSFPVIWRSAKAAAFCKILQSAATAVLTPLNIYFTQLLIDCIGLYMSGSVGLIHVLSLLLLLLISLFFLAGTAFFDNIILIKLKRDVEQNLTTMIANKFLTLEYRYLEDESTADTIARMGSSPQTAILDIFLNTLQCISAFVTILGTAAVFSQVSVWFAIIFLAMLLPMLWLDFRAMNMVNTLFNDQSEQERRLDYLSRLMQDKHALLELKLFSAVQYILTKWRTLNKQVLDERVKTTIRSQKYFAFSSVLVIIWVGSVTATLINQIQQAAITIGVFVSVMGAVGTMLSCSETLSHTFSAVSKKHLIMTHYRRFIALPVVESKPAVALPDPCIMFDDVHFSYPDTEGEVLRGISMRFEPGRHYALVGENGCGKSTVIKLMCKLYKPDSGRITINGIDLQNIPSQSLHDVFGIVFQDYMAYSLSLRENVAFGDIAQLANDDALQTALQHGTANQLLKSLPMGLDTSLGKLEEDGVDLSGGQWQRVAISRACLSNSPFVILDEPTAALDPVTEAEMYQSFASLLKDKGCIMISHRLASARLADTIYVIKNGVVAEKGDHDTLISQNGIYAAMFAAQSSWYNTTDKGENAEHEPK